MRSVHPEPGFYSAFRFYAGLHLVASLLYLAAVLPPHNNWQTGQTNHTWAVGFSIAHSAVLMGLLYWNWLERRLGAWYIPLLLGLATLGLLIEERVFLMQSVMPQGPFIYLLLILIAWQYSYRTVVAYTLGLAVLEGLSNTISPPTLSFVPAPPVSQAAVTLIILAARSFGLLLLGYVVSTLVRAQRQQRGELAEANRKLVSHAAALEQLATSRERLRLSRELHDTLAHTLSALAVQADAVLTVRETVPPKAGAMLEQMASTARAGLDETRRALRALRASPLEELGLAEALRALAEDCAARGNLMLNLELAETLDTLPPEVEQCFYRIAQEALENALRHAGAQSLGMELEFEERMLTLQLKDDGVGFDMQRQPMKDSLGLQGMRERAEMIGARLQVDSRPSQGTHLVLQWEVNE